MASKGLGKGFSALISENYVQPGAKVAAVQKSGGGVGGLSVLPLAKLHAGKYQPRTHFEVQALEELAASIKKNGVMQPILVRPSEKQAGKYEIIAGERRFRAAKIAKLDEVPVLVRAIDDQQALEMALVENIQRQDLSPLEEALGYERLIDEFKYTQEKLASTIGKSRSHVANTIRLLSLPDEVKKMIEKGSLTAGHARTLLNAPDPLALAKEIVSGKMTVRDAENVSREAKGQEKRPSAPRAQAPAAPAAPVAPAAPAAATGPKDPDIIALEDSLSESLGVRVSINDRGSSGEIVLAYDSLAQLDEILRRLGNSV
jgi:ParB family chromosome partitioning protein